MLGMGCRPSELIEIDDPYTAFCFDEACALIVSKIKEGEQPIIKEEKPKEQKITYNRPSDVYKKYSNANISKV